MDGETRLSRVRPGLDPPSKADHVRLRRARRMVRPRLFDQTLPIAKRRLAAFREEVGAVVRSASPLVVFMLDLHGRTLDEALDRMRPVTDWPLCPKLFDWRYDVLHPSLPLRRRGMVPKSQMTVPPFHGLTIFETAHERARLQMVDHSLELDGAVGPIRFRTRFGQLRIELEDDLPGTLLTACVGRRIGEIVDYTVWRDRDWTISAVEGAQHPWIGQTLFSAIGTVDYRVPWVR